MSRCLNRAELIGQLGAAPEIRMLQSGQAMATFSVATSWRWQDANDEAQEATEWSRCVVFGPLAEWCGAQLTERDIVCMCAAGCARGAGRIPAPCGGNAPRSWCRSWSALMSTLLAGRVDAHAPPPIQILRPRGGVRHRIGRRPTRTVAVGAPSGGGPWRRSHDVFSHHAVGLVSPQRRGCRWRSSSSTPTTSPR